MESTKPHFAFRLMPSLTDMAFLMPVVFLFARMDGVQTLLADGDTGWHIRTGDWILANHRIPTRDFFSFTKTGEPWYAWEWLSDVVFAWLNTRGGLATLVMASTLLIAVTFMLLFRLATRKSNPIVAVVITMVAAAASSVHWLARPHLFSLFFLVLFYFVVEYVRTERDKLHRIRLLALLPVVTVVWTNLHGGFFIGILMLAAYGSGEMVKLLFAADRSQAPAAWEHAREYFLAALACMAASLANPYFYRLHVHMFEYLSDPFPSQHIVEYQMLSFHHPAAIFFELLLILGTTAAIWHASRGSYTEAALILIFGHSALLAGRNIPLFAIVATPIAASAIDGWLKKLPDLDLAAWLRTASRKFGVILGEIAEIDAIPRWHLASVAGFAIVMALIYAPAPPRRFRPVYDPEAYPAGAIGMLKNDRSARIFTIDDWGDYLIFCLYPANRVFVDGRSDFYGDDFEQKYIDVMNVKYDWQQTLAHFGINTILLPPSAPLAGALKESSRWRVTYDDGVALIFRIAPPKTYTIEKSTQSFTKGDFRQQWEQPTIKNTVSDAKGNSNSPTRYASLSRTQALRVIILVVVLAAGGLAVSWGNHPKLSNGKGEGDLAPRWLPSTSFPKCGLAPPEASMAEAAG